MCTWLISTIYTLTLNLPELVPVRHGHPWPPEGPRPRRGAAASQIRPQSTGTRSGDLRPSEAYALPIQGYHLDLSTGACGAVLRSCCSHLHRLSYGTVGCAIANGYRLPTTQSLLGQSCIWNKPQRSRDMTARTGPAKFSEFSLPPSYSNRALLKILFTRRRVVAERGRGER